MKSYIFLVILIFTFEKIVCQNIDKYPDSVDSKDYFDNLYSKNSLNELFNIVTLEFAEKPWFAILSKGELLYYCKKKFNVVDSVAYVMSSDLLLNNFKLPLRDTIFFDNTQQHYYPVSILERYRKMKLVDFFNLYINRPSRLNIFLQAYLFEKRILYDPTPCECISPFTLARLEYKYSFFWNEREELWTKKNASEIVNNIFPQQSKYGIAAYPNKKDIEIFNNILLSNNADLFTYVRINFIGKDNQKYFLLTDLNMVYQFYKWKFKPKTENKLDSLQFISIVENEWPITDTIFFSTSNSFGNTEYKILKSSSLDKYERIGLENVFKEFLYEQNCFCNTWPSKLVAYLFEKKILINSDGVNRVILNNIEKKYKFIWNAFEYKWHYY